MMHNVFKVLSRLVIIGIYFFAILIFFLSYYSIKFFFKLINKKSFLPKNISELNGISFIIPNWNQAEMLLDCLKTLKNAIVATQLAIPIELIVIDNGSTDNSVGRITSDPLLGEVLFIKNQTNLGFARAINQGAQKASYNYLYLLNNDMMVKNDFLNALFNLAQEMITAQKPFLAISSQIFLADKTKRRVESGKTFQSLHLGLPRVSHCVNQDILNRNSMTSYPGGGASLINKALFLQLGGFDHQTCHPMYAEDFDLGFLAWKKGLTCYFAHQSQVIHHHRYSSKINSQDIDLMIERNLLAVFLKNNDSFCLVLKHLFGFSLRQLLKEKYSQIAKTTIKRMPLILINKIKTLKFDNKYGDKQFFEFVKTEIKTNL